MRREDTRTVAGREQRTSARHQVVELTWFKTLGICSENPREGISKMCDLSKNGVGLFLTQPLTVGELIFIEIASSKLRMSAVGRVVHQRAIGDDRYRVGIEFEVIPPNDRMVLADFFSRMRKTP